MTLINKQICDFCGNEIKKGNKYYSMILREKGNNTQEDKLDCCSICFKVIEKIRKERLQ